MKLPSSGSRFPSSLCVANSTGASSYPLELGEPLSEWDRRVAPRAVSGHGSAADRRCRTRRHRADVHPPERIRDDYLSAYDGDRFVKSMRYVRAYPTELPILRDLLPTIETPV